MAPSYLPRSPALPWHASAGKPASAMGSRGRLQSIVNEERRQHKRVARPFEGSWTGASGANSCRITDVSLGGCFVQTLATPTAGEDTQVTIAFGKDVSVTFAGKVIYVEPKMGFAVKFNDLDPEGSDQVRRLVDALAGRDGKP